MSNTDGEDTQQEGFQNCPLCDGAGYLSDVEFYSYRANEHDIRQELAKLGKMKTGIELIAEERKEQIEKHGFTFEKYDRYYVKGELLQAACWCLDQADTKQYFARPEDILNKWPENWDVKFKNKILNKSKVGKLIVAGAFFMAENDRVGDTLLQPYIDRIAAEIDWLQNMEKKRCECELFIEKYYALKADCNDDDIIKTTYSDLVNLLAMFRDEIKDKQLEFHIGKAFVAGRSKTSWEQFKKDNLSA